MAGTNFEVYGGRELFVVDSNFGLICYESW